VRSFIGGFDVSSAHGLLGRRRRTHENHEVSFMMIPFADAVPQQRMVSWRQTFGRCFTDLKDIAMKWETPHAVDFRFGMEITMYIANR
jgi:coenzyme PQQ precursor peptide PqqA